MTTDKLNSKVNELFRRERWAEARKVLDNERQKAPDCHWVLTQLGVTFYEQRRYKKALSLFLASQKIVPNCPLTLWNLAGTLDALGKPIKAIRIFARLAASKTTPDDDPCWESDEWAASLKTDCMYRLGLCFVHLGKRKVAETWYRRYVDKLLEGTDGSYTIEDVMQRIRGLQMNGKNGRAKPAKRWSTTSPAT